MSIEAELKKAILDPLVELFEFDLSAIGEGSEYFAPDTNADLSSIEFGGNTYIPIPISISEELMSGTKFPRPVLTVGDVFGVVFSAVREHNGLVGCKLKHSVTQKKFLDNGSDPDPTQIIFYTEWVIERVMSADKVEVKFELRNVMDVGDVQIPRQIVTRVEFPGAGRVRRVTG